MNRAIDAGRAIAREVMHRPNSINFPAVVLLGQSPDFTRARLQKAGKNKTGRGKKTLDNAVYLTAIYPAACDLP